MQILYLTNCINISRICKEKIFKHKKINNFFKIFIASQYFAVKTPGNIFLRVHIIFKKSQGFGMHKKMFTKNK